MDRALFRYEPLIVFIIMYCFLVFKFEFYFLKRYCTNVAFLCAVGARLLECAKSCWQPSGKFVTGGKRVLATLWQICNRVSEITGNPLKNSPEGTVLATLVNSTYLPQGCQHPLDLGQRVLMSL